MLAAFINANHKCTSYIQ